MRRPLLDNNLHSFTFSSWMACDILRKLWKFATQISCNYRTPAYTYVLLVLLLWLLALLGKPKLLKQFTFENKAVKKSPCLQNQLEWLLQICTCFCAFDSNLELVGCLSSVLLLYVVENRHRIAVKIFYNWLPIVDSPTRGFEIFFSFCFTATAGNKDIIQIWQRYELYYDDRIQW